MTCITGMSFARHYVLTHLPSWGTAILASLLPGLRELRTPIAAGAMWAAVLAFIGYPYAEDLRALHAVEVLAGMADAFPESVRWAAVLFAVYLVGVVARGVGRALIRSPWSSTLQERLRRSLRPTTRWIARRLLRPSSDVLSMVRSRVEDRLRRVSRVVRELVPLSLVMNEFELAELRLSHVAAEQFQQYDRVRAEAELRSNVATPLLVFGVVVAFRLPVLFGVPFAVTWVALSLGVGLQGIEDHHRADRLLASAMYFGLASTPTLDALHEGAQELDTDRSDPEVVDLAWLCDFLADRGMLDHVGLMIAKLRHPSRGEDRDRYHDAQPLMKEDTIRQLRNLEVRRDWEARFGTYRSGILEARDEVDS